MSKTAIRKIQDKVVTKIFVDRLEEFVAMWQRECPEKPFDEFLSEVQIGDTKLKVLNKALFNSFQRVVQIHIDLWRTSATEKSFDEYLRGAKYVSENK